MLSRLFPVLERGVEGRSLHENVPIRGQLHSRGYYPTNFVEDAPVDDEERSLQFSSMNGPRVERIFMGVPQDRSPRQMDHVRRL